VLIKTLFGKMATYKDYIYKGYHVRHFSEDVEMDELVWHRDRKDRDITPIGETDWQIQFDDELPQPINDCIFIPEGTWHRVIKGSGCLKILINEYA
tara:strand:- start:197 stop:484 length:288 start_codon:yes stop_codon:yes gene_type:complete